MQRKTKVCQTGCNIPPQFHDVVFSYSTHSTSTFILAIFTYLHLCVPVVLSIRLKSINSLHWCNTEIFLLSGRFAQVSRPAPMLASTMQALSSTSSPTKAKPSSFSSPSSTSRALTAAVVTSRYGVEPLLESWVLRKTSLRCLLALHVFIFVFLFSR